MLVIEYRPADDRQIGIASYEIIRKKIDKIEKFVYSFARHLHRNVFLVEHYAMLVEIRVRRILHHPRDICPFAWAFWQVSLCLCNLFRAYSDL